MKYLAPILVIFFLTFPILVHAQGSATERLIVFINKLQFFLWTVGSAIAIVVVIVGGIMYMTAGGNEEKVKTARRTIAYALIGLAIVLCSGFIIELVEEVIANLTAA